MKNDKNDDENDKNVVFDDVELIFKFKHDFENLKKIRVIKRKKSKKFEKLNIWKLNNEFINDNLTNLKKKLIFVIFNLFLVWFAKIINQKLNNVTNNV